MVKDNDTKANGSGSGERPVGRGNPPKETQWKEGQSGNPRGRPRGVRNVATEVLRMLRTQTDVPNGDRVRSTTTQEAAYIVLRDKALAGEARALDRLLDEAARYNNEPSATKKGPLPEEDRAILDAFIAEVLAAAGVSGGSKKNLPRSMSTPR